MSRFTGFHPASSTSASSRGELLWSRNSNPASPAYNTPVLFAGSTEKRSVSFKNPLTDERYNTETEDNPKNTLESGIENAQERRFPHWSHDFMQVPPTGRTVNPFVSQTQTRSHIPISTRGSNSWTTNSTQDSTIYLEFDCSEDIESYLEELSFLKRLGRFNDAKRYFKAYRVYCGDHPDLIIDYIDTLLSQGAWKDVLELITSENPPILTKDCGQIYHHYLHSALCVAKAVTLGCLEDAVLQWGQAKSELISELKRDFTCLSSLQIRFLCHLVYLETSYVVSINSSYPNITVGSIPGSDWHELYSYLLLTNRIWDMRDMFYRLIGSSTVKQVMDMFFDTEMSLDQSINTFVAQWTQENDESTDLAILDVLVTVSLQGIPDKKFLDKAERQSIDLCMVHAREIASSIRDNYPASIKSSPYLRWILAEIRWDDVSGERQKPSPWSYLDNSPGLLYFDGSLPVYIPFASENPGWRVWPNSEHSVELLTLGLNTARDLGHYDLEVLYLEELVCRSSIPQNHLADLENLQKNIIGNKSRYLSACLAQYLLATDQEAQRNLSNQLSEIDQQEHSASRERNPIMKWAQRKIQQALCHSLGGSQEQQDLYSWMERSAYQQIPDHYRDRLRQSHHASHDIDYYQGGNQIAKYVAEGRTSITSNTTIAEPRISSNPRPSSPPAALPNSPSALVVRGGTSSSIIPSRESPILRLRRDFAYTPTTHISVQGSHDDRDIIDPSPLKYGVSETQDQASSLPRKRDDISSKQVREMPPLSEVDNKAGTRSVRSESRGETSVRVNQDKGIDKHDDIRGEPSRAQEIHHNSLQADRTERPKAQYIREEETKKDFEREYASGYSSNESHITMGELLGVVASGIAVAQLAGAIVGSSQKIYSFYSEMKDAPKKLGDLLVEIELLGEVLVDFYDQNSNPTTGQSKVVPKVLKHCRTVIENLDKILKVLEDSLKKDGGMIKRQWRTLKVVLKEKTLEELTERLERAKSLLTLAVNCHSMHLNKAMQQTLIQLSTSGMNTQTTQTNKAVAIPEHNYVPVSKKESTSIIRRATNSYGFFSYWSTTSVLNQQNKKKHFAKLTTDPIIADENTDMDVDLTILPKAWIRLKGMHIKQSRRFGRWTYYFRPIRVVTDNSPIFDACRNGDIGGVLQLVHTGKASVFDTSQGGCNLLHVAAAHLNANLCRWLIAQGVQATECDAHQGWTALNFVSKFCNESTVAKRIRISHHDSRLPALWSFQNEGRFNEALETIRVLVEVGKADPMQVATGGTINLTSLHLYDGSTESFNYMLRQEEFLVSTDAQESPGMNSVFYWKLYRGFENLGILKILSERDTQFLESQRLKDGLPSFPKALHRMLYGLIKHTCRPEQAPEEPDWLISSFLEMGANVHLADEYQMTPLNCCFSYPLCYPFFVRKDAEGICLAVISWFKLLRKAGYDLQEYLLRESAYYERCIINLSVHNGFVWSMDVYLSRSTTDIICSFGLYDYRRERRNMTILQHQKKEKMPGAWKNSSNKNHSKEDLTDIYHSWISDIRRPSRSPDFEIHDTKTGELDLCSCLDEVGNDGGGSRSGCKCENEDENDSGSEVESEVESIDESNEYEDRSDDGGEVESENESINDSNQHEKEQKEEVLEEESELECGAELLKVSALGGK
ncbi:hypothetical protein BPAE_0009g00110 [Botrytis paeoniae]|uniref:Uncharacterized protein n=1 Tax=Botrytis paeoniae TaxID=278948 RepID=A0A4Z1G7D9_9HELO|nr:hypothetical protein BPAE_0009g00110 [Botrytis paeoniae]